MKGRQLVVVAMLAVASATGGFFFYRGVDSTGPASPAAGSIPSFVLTDTDGEARNSNEWDGQVRLVNFWATWCPPCRREIPLLIELQKDYDQRIQVIGIAIDDLEAVQAYALASGFNYPVLVGQQEAVDLANAFLRDFVGLPFTAFADSKGNIVRVHVGELHRDQADEFLAEIL